MPSLLRIKPNPLIANRNPGGIRIPARLNGDGGMLRPITDGIGNQIKQNLQNPPKLTNRRNHMVLGRRHQRNPPLGSPHGKNPRSTPSTIRQIDTIRRRIEFRRLNRIEIGKILDKRQQMPPRLSNISSIARVFIHQRPRKTRTNGLGIGNNTIDRLTQSRRKIPTNQPRPTLARLQLSLHHNSPRNFADRVNQQQQIKPDIPTRQQTRPPDLRRARNTDRSVIDQPPMQRLPMRNANKLDRLRPDIVPIRTPMRRQINQRSIGRAKIDRQHPLISIKQRMQPGGLVQQRIRRTTLRQSIAHQPPLAKLHARPAIHRRNSGKKTNRLAIINRADHPRLRNPRNARVPHQRQQCRHSQHARQITPTPHLQPGKRLVRLDQVIG